MVSTLALARLIPEGHLELLRSESDKSRAGITARYLFRILSFLNSTALAPALLRPYLSVNVIGRPACRFLGPVACDRRSMDSGAVAPGFQTPPSRRPSAAFYP